MRTASSFGQSCEWWRCGLFERKSGGRPTRVNRWSTCRAPKIIPQQWFNLSDLAVEATRHDSGAMCEFAGIDVRAEPASDESKVCKFRHPLERHKLGKRLLAAVNRHAKTPGIKIRHGTIVDATAGGHDHARCRVAGDIWRRDMPVPTTVARGMPLHREPAQRAVQTQSPGQPSVGTLRFATMLATLCR